jgi:hypothetical protein
VLDFSDSEEDDDTPAARRAPVAPAVPAAAAAAPASSKAKQTWSPSLARSSIWDVSSSDGSDTEASAAESVKPEEALGHSGPAFSSPKQAAGPVAPAPNGAANIIFDYLSDKSEEDVPVVTKSVRAASDKSRVPFKASSLSGSASALVRPDPNILDKPRPNNSELGRTQQWDLSDDSDSASTVSRVSKHQKDKSVKAQVDKRSRAERLVNTWELSSDSDMEVPRSGQSQRQSDVQSVSSLPTEVQLIQSAEADDDELFSAVFRI